MWRKAKRSWMKDHLRRRSSTPSFHNACLMAAVHLLMLSFKACMCHWCCDRARFQVMVQICQIIIMLAYGCHYFWLLRFFRLRLALDCCLAGGVLVYYAMQMQLVMVSWSGAGSLAVAGWRQPGNKFIVDAEKWVVNAYVLNTCRWYMMCSIVPQVVAYLFLFFGQALLELSSRVAALIFTRWVMHSRFRKKKS